MSLDIEKQLEKQVKQTKEFKVWHLYRPDLLEYVGLLNILIVFYIITAWFLKIIPNFEIIYNVFTLIMLLLILIAFSSFLLYLYFRYKYDSKVTLLGYYYGLRYTVQVSSREHLNYYFFKDMMAIIDLFAVEGSKKNNYLYRQNSKIEFKFKDTTIQLDNDEMLKNILKYMYLPEREGNILHSQYTVFSILHEAFKVLDHVYKIAEKGRVLSEDQPYLAYVTGYPYRPELTSDVRIIRLISEGGVISNNQYTLLDEYLKEYIPIVVNIYKERLEIHRIIEEYDVYERKAIEYENTLLSDLEYIVNVTYAEYYLNELDDKWSKLKKTRKSQGIEADIKRMEERADEERQAALVEQQKQMERMKKKKNTDII